MKPTALAFALLFAAAAAAAQSGPAFEVVSIKPSAPVTDMQAKMQAMMASMGRPSGPADAGRVTYNGVTVQSLLMQAYGLKDYQIEGPKWIASDRFDIVATLPPDADKAQIPAMLQRLLADRFQLTFHRDTKDTPTYNLVVAKGGSRLTPAAPPAAADTAPMSQDAQKAAAEDLTKKALAGMLDPAVKSGSGLSIRTDDRQTMAGFATWLSSQRDIGRPVFDHTGLNGEYRTTLSWQPASAAASADATGPTIFAALQDQLGLRLEPATQPIPRLIVDHALETPVAN